MKALSKLIILLSILVVLPICNSSGNINNTQAHTTYQVFHSFAGQPNDGAYPMMEGLIQASDGNFYGTTKFGGVGNGGTIFKITLAGVETILCSFANDEIADGFFPNELIQGNDGNFYGTTSSGGSNNAGTVFEVTPQGQKTVLYRFVGGSDGSYPETRLIQGSDGNFYGTTLFGGGGQCVNNYSGCGTVFKITPQGQETVLYRFADGNDGTLPQSGLIQANDGNFYGTTTGTVFKITPQGQETVLYRFTGGNDGYNSFGVIQGSDGNFYGTTFGGGSGGYGTVFKITPQGQETVLYSFVGGYNDGENPYAGIIEGKDGSLYGTTFWGGSIYNLGTVFKITPHGQEIVLHSFIGGNDGNYPWAGLIQGNDGNFYGTTYQGGSNNNGTVFKISINK